MTITTEELYKKFQDHQHSGVDGTLRLPKAEFTSVVLAGTTPATAANYGIFFVATRPCFVKAISEVHSTAGSSTPTLQVERLRDTEALDAGDELLVTAFNLAGTANTVQEGNLNVANKTFMSLNVGDRLALKDIGTLTAIAGLCVTVELQYA